MAKKKNDEVELSDKTLDENIISESNASNKFVEPNIISEVDDTKIIENTKNISKLEENINELKFTIEDLEKMKKDLLEENKELKKEIEKYQNFKNNSSINKDEEINYKYKIDDSVIYPKEHYNKRFKIMKLSGKSSEGPMYRIFSSNDDTLIDFIPEKELKLSESPESFSFVIEN